MDGEYGLIDVSGMTLRELADSDDDALARCAQRLLDDLERSEGALSAFQSAVEVNAPPDVPGTLTGVGPGA